MRLVRPFRIGKRAFSEFGEDGAMMLGAALAFYTALSFAPLLLIVLFVAGTLGAGSQASVVGQIEQLVGPQAASTARMVMENAGSKPAANTLAGIFGIATLLFSATGVFAQLQTSLNRIWDVKANPGAGFWTFVRRRVLSLGMVLGILFLLLVSLVVSAVLSSAMSGTSPVWQVLNFVVSLVVYAGLFALLFRYVPDVRIRWRDAIVGAAVTAVLFAVGKWAIGLYLGNSGVGSSYGAAGSLIVMLVWAYYASLILFLGAEVTQAYAKEYGARIRPDSHAVWVEGGGREERDASQQDRSGARRATASSPS